MERQLHEGGALLVRLPEHGRLQDEGQEGRDSGARATAVLSKFVTKSRASWSSKPVTVQPAAAPTRCLPEICGLGRKWEERRIGKGRTLCR